jgi:glycosyltransferase involved in cell wall biosynthesis
MSSQPSSSSRVLSMRHAEFARCFGRFDFGGALCGYTPEVDTHAVLTLLAHARPRRVLEIGTALGHMTANFTRWTLDDAQIFSLGTLQETQKTSAGAREQQVEEPGRGEFGRFADQFGKAWKVFFIIADSMVYDFGRLAPLDFVFIDGGHDLEHALNDSRKAYQALDRGGWLVWHDFDSLVPWVKVREAIERLGFSEPLVHVEGTQVAFLRKQAPLPSPPVGPAHPGPVRVAWEGDPHGLHSLALVNRALCGALLDRGHDLGLIWDSKAAEGTTAIRTLDARLAARLGCGPVHGVAQGHVGHQWPPRLEPPRDGRWVLMQPWEFGSLPKNWLGALRQVDEIWAYSRSVRDCYLEAGVAPERVHVIPLGVQPEVFRPGLEPLALQPGPDFRFLFVGGTIFRKGIDVLLAAFARAFGPGDNVGLVIKDMGTKSFYRGQTAEAKIAGLRERGYSVEYIDRDLDGEELPRLYAACHCLVHPFRGEGFALPVVEAMACGLPVIVTGAGPVLDYASEETAFFIQ